MKSERSVITVILLRLDYLIYGLINCVDDTPTEIGLIKQDPNAKFYFTIS